MKILGEVKELECTFKVQYYWEADQLIFECPTSAARDYMARVLDEGPILVRIKKKA